MVASSFQPGAQSPLQLLLKSLASSSSPPPLAPSPSSGASPLSSVHRLPALLLMLQEVARLLSTSPPSFWPFRPSSVSPPGFSFFSTTLFFFVVIFIAVTLFGRLAKKRLSS